MRISKGGRQRFLSNDGISCDNGVDLMVTVVSGALVVLGCIKGYEKRP